MLDGMWSEGKAMLPLVEQRDVDVRWRLRSTKVAREHDKAYTEEHETAT